MRYAGKVSCVTIADGSDATPLSMRAFTRPSVIRSWLDEAGLRPNRLLGQNFLIDGNILGILLEAAQIGPQDRVLEVGPGLGALTAGLLESGARVVAIEKDMRLLPLLEQHLPFGERLKIIAGDALDHAVSSLVDDGINKFVANLPYTPGTRILVDVATSPHRPAMIAVMVQDEVAERVAADPGTTDFGLLGLWCRVFYDVRYVKRVSPNCFWPRPKVQSAIVALRRLETPLIPDADWPFFQKLTRRLFQHRRKQMGHLLASIAPPEAHDAIMVEMLAPECRQLRPEALPLDVWCSLSENIRRHFGDETGLRLGPEGESDGW
jgi:16S rRNA (adenine1518-N6/adenine1519-N6)-dimethyltransferase